MSKRVICFVACLILFFFMSGFAFAMFDEKELRKAIEEYSRRQRRFGGS